MASNTNAIMQLIESQNSHLQLYSSGMLTKLLQTGVAVDTVQQNDEGIEVTVTENKELSLREVMLDPDFLAEAKMSNELLLRYMTREKVL